MTHESKADEALSQVRDWNGAIQAAVKLIEDTQSPLLGLGLTVALKGDDAGQKAINEISEVLTILAAEIASLSRPSQEAEGWRDISTAPKDGTVVLAVCGEAQYPAARISWWDAEVDGWVVRWKPEKFVDRDPAQWWPTHFQPLPSASSLAKGA